ncbi:MAG: hypothetical protein Phog2KO_50900 [Phototrophicaceae bacterium]
MGYFVGGVELQVYAADPDHQWGLIDYNGYEGWVQFDEIVLQGGNRYALPQLEEVRESTVSVETVANLNLRANPSVLSARLTSIPQNASLEATGRTADNSWLVVSYNGHIGWVSLLYLNSADENAPAFDDLPIIMTLQTDGLMTASTTFGDVVYRTGPLASTEIAGTISQNETFQILQVDPSLLWGQISMDDTLYWVYLNDLNLNGNPSELALWVSTDDLVNASTFTAQQRQDVQDLQAYFSEVVEMVDFLEDGIESPVAVCSVLQNDYEPYYPITAAFVEVPELGDLITHINDITGDLNIVMDQWLIACSTNTLAGNDNLDDWQQTILDADDDINSIERQLATLNTF